jgi:hypothetical protein
VGGFVLAYAVAIAWFSRANAIRVNTFHEWWWRGEHAWPGVHYALDRLGHAFMDAMRMSGLVLVVGTALTALGFAVRTVVRAQSRAGRGDRLAGVRRWVEAHPSWTRFLTALPAAALALLAASKFNHNVNGAPLILDLGVGALWLMPSLVAALGWTAATRLGLRALVAPPLADARADAQVTGDEITFDAVAVTREARAAVGGVAALTMAMIAWLISLPVVALFHDPRVFAAIAAYVAVALGGAALFRRVSRVAIGLDGVLVTGSSRTRFLAYRELDDARVTGGDLELVRGGEVTLRLQLHGEDATRRDAILERLRAAIARMKDERGHAATDFVASASPEALTRVAHGAGDYRVAALSREQLWTLVEGPAIDGAARRTAARALAASGDVEERTRLRVAAEHCAEPQVRIALQKLADGDLLEDDELAVAPPRRAALR